MKRRLSLFLCACLGLLIASPLSALPKPNANTQLFKPAVDGKGLVTNEGGDILRHLKYTVNLILNYSSQPVRVDDRFTGKHWLVSDRISADLGVALGLWDRLELGINIPATFYQHGYRLDDPLVRVREKWMLGDASLYFKVLILPPEKFKHFGLNFQMGMTFPTSDPKTGVGDGDFTFSPQINFSYDDLFYVGLNVGATFRITEYQVQNLRYNHDFRANLGIGYRFKSVGVTVFGEVAASTPLDSRWFDYGPMTPIEAGVGVIWKSKFGLHVLAGASMGLGVGVGGPRPRGYIGFRWTNDLGDLDNDGIADHNDPCPTVWGPRANNGCPWGDRDGDGVLDNVDKCPNVAGPRENQGCPWGDKDGDGVLDNVDKCPDVAGPRENGGCPWGDRDRDGVTDNIDKCPDVPGARDNHGCPWGDRDRDGVTDNIDKCPDVPGPASNQGCPLKKLKFLAQRIFFKSGSHKLRKDSLPVIAAIAEILKKHATVRIRIEGHTSKVGSAKSNLKLSKRRANTVFEQLTKVHGIKPERLTHEGFGFSRPLMDGNSKEAHAKNRRVEMIVINK